MRGRFGKSVCRTVSACRSVCQFVPRGRGRFTLRCARFAVELCELFGNPGSVPCRSTKIRPPPVVAALQTMPQDVHISRVCCTSNIEKPGAAPFRRIKIKATGGGCRIVKPCAATQPHFTQILVIYNCSKTRPHCCTQKKNIRPRLVASEALATSMST